VFFSPWYKNIVFYLQTLEFPPNFSQAKSRSLKLQEIKYCIIYEKICWKDPLGILWNYIVEEDTKGNIDEFHKGICGEHHAWRAITYKILRDGYYWPKLISEVNAKIRSCKECHIFVGKQKLPFFLLVPIKVEAPFQQWSWDFIGEIHPASSAQHKWILTTTNHFSKWVETTPTKFATDAVVIKFLEENILVRFGCPRKIITDNA
jgi:hypothetical protein